MKAQILIDWLTFTIKGLNDTFYVIEHFLKINRDLFIVSDSGRYGYKKMMSYSGINIYYDGREFADKECTVPYPMGVCVDMSGNACRVFESVNISYQLLDLARAVLESDDDFNFTRIDLACDDKVGSLNIDTIHSYIEAGNMNTRINTYNVQQSKKIDSEKWAKTLYIGSQTSEFRLRIYDKAKEQGDFESHWVRFEMVCRKEYALGAVTALVNTNNIGDCVAGMLRQRVEFIERDSKNISRCTIAEWWNDFLNIVQSVEFFFKEKAIQSSEKLYFWFKTQLSSCVSMASDMFGSEFWTELSTLGKGKLSTAQRALVRDYLSRFEMQGQINFDDVF